MPRQRAPRTPDASPSREGGVCAIDFGTSNSAIARITPEGERLVVLEAGQVTMPTAVFYAVEGLAAHESPQRLHGRAAVAAYVEGIEGRLMRSMKSILGSSLAEQATDLGAGHAVRYLDVVSGYLQHLKAMAEAEAEARSEGDPAAAHAQPLTRVVLGRPVHFVDDDPERDALAQAMLERAARSVGFEEVRFQFEPIAAALDHESRSQHEELVLVADIGGGTSDFSLIRVGPERAQRLDRSGDILANHGVHLAGTDFDRHIELDTILPLAGYRAHGPTGREVPSKVYFDLATWHLINTVYLPLRVGELRRMGEYYADRLQHQRLMRVIDGRLGHALIARAEAAKIAVAESGHARLDLQELQPEARPPLAASLTLAQAVEAIESDLARIVAAARATVREAGVAAEQVQALYFTGGSTGLKPLAERIAAGFPAARQVSGDRFASVAQGLARHARQLWGPQAARGAARG